MCLAPVLFVRGALYATCPNPPTSSLGRYQVGLSARYTGKYVCIKGIIVVPEDRRGTMCTTSKRGINDVIGPEATTTTEQVFHAELSYNRLFRGSSAVGLYLLMLGQAARRRVRRDQPVSTDRLLCCDSALRRAPGRGLALKASVGHRYCPRGHHDEEKERRRS